MRRAYVTFFIYALNRALFCTPIRKVLLSLATSCANGTQMVEIVSIDAPDVTVQYVTGGVLLSWPPVVEADYYEVWRKQIDAEPEANWVKLAELDDRDTYTYDFWDIVSYENDLQADTEYTYKVLSIPVMKTLKDTGVWEGDVDFDTSSKDPVISFPEKGSKAAAPTKVDLILDYEEQTVTFSVTPAAADPLPNFYTVTFEKNGEVVRVDPGYTYSDPVSLTFTVKKVYYATKYVIPNQYSWTFSADKSEPNNSWGMNKFAYDLLSAQGSKLTIKVQGTIGSTGSDYYQPSDYLINPKTLDALIGGSFSGSADPVKVIADGKKDKATAIEVVFNLGSLKTFTGVTYSIERGIADASGNVNYQLFTGLTKKVLTTAGGSTTTTFESVGFDMDDRGNLKEQTVYDRTLTLKNDKVQYRIKAVKDKAVSYIESSLITIDLAAYAAPIITVAAKTTSGTNDVFKISASVSAEGLLKDADNDKLVIFWVTGNSNAYKTGPYTTSNSVTFTKADLELFTPKEKEDLKVPTTKPAGVSLLFIQAYLEVDGVKKVIANSGDAQFGSIQGSGLSAYGGGGWNNGQYHVQLNW